MTADIKLLPLPEPAAGYGRGCNIELADGQPLYTAEQVRACVAHHTAAKDAEIERLRDEVVRVADIGLASANASGSAVFAKQIAENRAERLAEALRDIAEPLDCGCRPCHGRCRDMAWEWMQETAKEALRDHD